jgi:hypothetical protein
VRFPAFVRPCVSRPSRTDARIALFVPLALFDRVGFEELLEVVQGVLAALDQRGVVVVHEVLRFQHLAVVLAETGDAGVGDFGGHVE